ncbi:Uncharacterised protein [Mycobacterium tuberculosis]|nr:Uncharacterised protein [Mycobacterium tuberculosis]CKS55116.1 Uncharacterised protein [Mycobacterium tuberculosis]CNL75852.1 Uncharacterised protein [Mycobacterium tuberculosis]
MHFIRVRLDADVADTGVGERRREIPRPAANVEQRTANWRLAMCGQPQIADHCCGVGRQCAIEPCRVALLVAEVCQQSQRAPQCRPSREHIGDRHLAHPTAR